MKRLLAKWLIGHSVDSGKPLPGWVRRLTETDEVVRDEYESMQSMVRQLRDDSSAFFPAEQQAVMANKPARPRQTRSMTAVIAIAAVVLLTAALWQLQRETPQEVIVEQPVSPTENDIKLVEAAIAGPRKLVDRLAARASSLAEQTPTISRPDVAAFTTKPVRAAGRKFGEILAVFVQTAE